MNSSCAGGFADDRDVQVSGPVIQPQTGAGKRQKEGHGVKLAQDVSWLLPFLFLLLMITVSPTQDGIPLDTKILDLSGNKLRWVEHGDLLPINVLKA
ncbi:hypothetical protein D9C73_027870 [Collichthys lucidus]|uniref:Uncharacterized protein n=1 Tax=Collichthys lucidus TaxID=240159 RepID=A0A4U5TVX6_COLLU|nr:hypothetical protein D9C73_027870 [Collichthys lucidus]